MLCRILSALGSLTWRQTTEYFILGNVCISAIYAMIARIFGGTNATISVVMEESGKKYPIIVGVCFFLLAHWFFPTRYRE